jgi:hypothetical protein
MVLAVALPLAAASAGSRSYAQGGTIQRGAAPAERA